MRRLSAGLRVLVFDKRGIGMSDRLTEAVDLETRMDDVGAVMDAAGVERAALLGWGTGGSAMAALLRRDASRAYRRDPHRSVRPVPEEARLAVRVDRGGVRGGSSERSWPLWG